MTGLVVFQRNEHFNGRKVNLLFLITFPNPSSLQIMSFGTNIDWLLYNITNNWSNNKPNQRPNTTNIKRWIWKWYDEWWKFRNLKCIIWRFMMLCNITTTTNKKWRWKWINARFGIINKWLIFMWRLRRNRTSSWSKMWWLWWIIICRWTWWRWWWMRRDYGWDGIMGLWWI